MHLLVCCLLVGACSSCTFFTTRTPEPPDTRRSSFQPPTSSQVVISNIQAAIREKNIENYIQSFVAGDSGTAQQRFSFEPSAEAAARFASVFIGWNVVKERQSFTAFTAKIPAAAAPTILLSNDRFELMSPDSVVFVADYVLRPNAPQSGIGTEFAGRMRISIVSFANGFWAIRRWTDQALPQSQSASWSVLKAQFAN
ncbi:MAG: hypothetical protein EAZ92_14460 [Candidatus Kapaibacterium sp.]|nr:MAG: hypothetical protein EAZ92_14460 [Candidatus Kapabacteria bacterium]